MRDHAERVGAIAQHLIEEARQTYQRRENENRNGNRQGGQDGAALVAREIAENESEIFHALGKKRGDSPALTLSLEQGAAKGFIARLRPVGKFAHETSRSTRTRRLKVRRRA